MSFVGANDEREEFRVRYPVADRPQFNFGGAQATVIDLSVSGFRIALPAGVLPVKGQAIRGSLKLLAGGEHKIDGTALRITRDQMVIALPSQLPFRLILGEDRYLTERYPSRRKVTRNYVEGAPEHLRGGAAPSTAKAASTPPGSALTSANVADVIILAMASLAEARDNETGNHLRRVQGYVKVLAEALRHHPRFSNELTEPAIDAMCHAAPMHDIGKVGIPDRVLFKGGQLDEAEWEIMKTHPTIGFDALASAERALGIHNDFLRYAKEIALSHQEKWDGSGYPQGLAGDDIPLSARLMAVADVYDALISKRPYKEPLTHADSVKMISARQGSHFDPDIVDAFLSVHEQFEAIAASYTDT